MDQMDDRRHCETKRTTVYNIQENLVYDFEHLGLKLNKIWYGRRVEADSSLRAGFRVP